MLKPSFINSSGESYPRMSRADLLMLMIRDPSRVWHITPHSRAVKIVSRVWFFWVISFS